MMPRTDQGTSNFVNDGGDTSFMAFPMGGHRVGDLLGVASDTTPFPMLVSIEDVIKWFHRVRQWKVIANHDLWIPNTEAILFLNQGAINDEEIVMTAQAGNWQGIFEWTDTLNFVHPVYLYLTILGGASFSHLQKSYYIDGAFADIVPYLRLTTVIDGIDGNQVYGDTGSFLEANPGDYPSPELIDGQASCSIEGLPFTMNMVGRGPSSGSGFETGPMSFDLTPSLFWEYRDADGTNPKYDALTGVPL